MAGAEGQWLKLRGVVVKLFVGQGGFLGGRRWVGGFFAWSRGAMLLGVPG